MAGAHLCGSEHCASSIQAHFLETALGMIQREVTIRNRAGLHTRPAASLVKLAARFKSDLLIDKDGFEINGKSIIGVMTLAAEHGSKLMLRFSGDDEEEACKAMVDLFERGFDEA